MLIWAAIAFFLTPSTANLSACHGTTVPREGPNDDTSMLAKNIWRMYSCIKLSKALITNCLVYLEETEKKSPFFPRVHYLLCAHPNMVPIAMTTSVGPRGGVTVLYQAQAPKDNTLSTISDAILDSQLHDAAVNQVSSPLQAMPQKPEPTKGAPNSPLTPDQEKLVIAMQKAHMSIKPTPKKCGFKEQLVHITEYVLQ